MNHIICGNSLDILDNPIFPAEYFHACITSPPYWTLRDYGKGVECVFGGDEGCRHEWGLEGKIHTGGQQKDEHGGQRVGRDFSAQNAVRDRSTGQFCSLCGAWRGQLGLEPTPELYVEHLLLFLRQVWRVLRKDGTCWLNLGDSYAGSGKGQMGDGTHAAKCGEKQKTNVGTTVGGLPASYSGGGLKPKDLCMMPFRVARAAQQDGWWVRHVIPWYKLNPMPESSDDRPTTGHEYVLLLTKSGSKQYWTHPEKLGARKKPEPDYRWRHKESGLEVDYQPVASPKLLKKLWSRRNLWEGHDYFWDADAIRVPHSPDGRKQTKAPIGPGSHECYQGAHMHERWPGQGRNRRTSDWFFDVMRAAVGDFTGLLLDSQGQPIAFILPTEPYPEAHFATFPEALVEPMILTTPTKCCAECGAGWERVTAPSAEYQKRLEATRNAPKWYALSSAEQDGNGGLKGQPTGGFSAEYHTLGFRPTCSCNADAVPARVLDLFAGRGTVGKGCERHRRDYVLIDMNQEYIPMMLRYLDKADVEYEINDEAWIQPRLIHA